MAAMLGMRLLVGRDLVEGLVEQRVGHRDVAELVALPGERDDHRPRLLLRTPSGRFAHQLRPRVLFPALEHACGTTNRAAAAPLPSRHRGTASWYFRLRLRVVLAGVAEAAGLFVPGRVTQGRLLGKNAPGVGDGLLSGRVRTAILNHGQGAPAEHVVGVPSGERDGCARARGRAGPTGRAGCNRPASERTMRRNVVSLPRNVSASAAPGAKPNRACQSWMFSSCICHR